MHMVFLTNIHTQTKHLYKELVTRYVSFKGWETGKARSPLIRTEIKVGSAILIHVFILTCLKVKFIGICIMHKARI